MADAFISYSRKDAAKADLVVEHLRLNGLTSWRDTDDRIPPGNRWRVELKRAIEAAGCLIVIVTPDALASSEVAQEAQHGNNCGKPLVPLILSLPESDKADSVDQSLETVLAPIDSAQLPVWLAERQLIDARRKDSLAKALDQVLGAVRQDHKWRQYSEELLNRASHWSAKKGALLSDMDLDSALDWSNSMPAGSAPPNELQLAYIRASEEALERGRAERADRLADRVLAGFYNPDLSIPLAAANITANFPSEHAVLALDRTLRVSRSLGPVGPTGEIACLRFLEQEDQLFIGYQDGDAWVIHLNDGEILARWSPDGSGRTIRAVSDAGVVILEDGGKCLRVDPFTKTAKHLDYFLPYDLAAADFDHSERWLLTADHRGHSWLWDMDKQKPVQELVPPDENGRWSTKIKNLRSPRSPEIAKDKGLRPHGPSGAEPVTAALSSDGQYAAVGRYLDQEFKYLVTVHNTRTGRQVWQRRSEQHVTSLHFRGDQHQLLFICENQGYLKPLPKGKAISLLGDLSDIPGALVASPDGSLGAAVGQDGYVRIFDFDKTYDTLALLGGHDFLTAVAPCFSGNELLITGLLHDTARLWDLRGNGEQKSLDMHDCAEAGVVVYRDTGVRPLAQMDVSPDGSRLFATADPLLACVWALDDPPKHIDLYPPPAPEERHLAWLADSTLVGIPFHERQSVFHYTPCDDGYEYESLLSRRVEQEKDDGFLTLEDFGIQDTERLMDEGIYTGLATSADGHRIAVDVGGWSVATQVWALDPLTQLLEIPGNGLLALSSDGSHLLRADDERGYSLWHVDTGQHIKTPPIAGSSCHLGTWSPHDDRYAVAHNESITVIDANGTTPPIELLGHRARVFSIAFCPKGERLVSGAQDGALRVWDSRNGAELRRLDLPRIAVTAVCFTGDGESVVSGTTDGLIRIWQLWKVDDLLAMATQRGPELSESELRRYGITKL
ncbi:MAG: toll/interleukin-1 receptor domain-containing protein [Gammaproteobacteria bacterium (ex Lamellibrachia satsuma)]|nr:MAG: toll/interleukin-1 receptor domain-containing protein [Gammaproteobacteria bacterium (ex Lamellibrachia satsuma)]